MYSRLASPVIDLDNDGVETVGLDAGIQFDHNNNGTIDNGSELFGENTITENGTANTGFEALATIDSNNDGIIDVNFTQSVFEGIDIPDAIKALPNMCGFGAVREAA